MSQVIYKTTDPVWYAMKASYGKALKAKVSLDSMQIENYVPMRYEKRRVNGHNEIVPIAAIPNLIFIKCDILRLGEAKDEIGFLHNILIKSDEGNTLEPIIVPELDMARFIRVVTDAQERVKYVDMELNRQIVNAGTKVRIIDGMYKGYEGVLCRPKGSRARKVLIDVCGLAPVELPVIEIELLQEI
ncbi:MAG: UpxY family transcription antiterminator [Rikenellaceae bacterium]